MKTLQKGFASLPLLLWVRLSDQYSLCISTQYLSRALLPGLSHPTTCKSWSRLLRSHLPFQALEAYCRTPNGVRLLSCSNTLKLIFVCKSRDPEVAVSSCVLAAGYAHSLLLGQTSLTSCRDAVSGCLGQGPPNTSSAQPSKVQAKIDWFVVT